MFDFPLRQRSTNRKYQAVSTYSKGNNENKEKYIFTCHVVTEESMFFNIDQKIPHQQFSIFLSFMTIFYNS